MEAIPDWALATDNTPMKTREKQKAATRVTRVRFTITASFHLLGRAAIGVKGGAFSNPKRDFYRTRLVLARHLFVIRCHEGKNQLASQPISCNSARRF